MTRIRREELANLDITFAQFIAPRLRAFLQATDSYPDDLPDIQAWRAELDTMADAFEQLGCTTDYENIQPALQLFVRRLPHLWQ